MSRGKGTKRRRGWLVRMDPELMRDIDFHDHCTLDARVAYIDSLFYLAATDGPFGLYPHTEVAAEFGRAAEQVAQQLITLGVWQDAALGYAVAPYCGWRLVPEYRAPIPDALRQKVYARDDYTCQECGSKDDLTLDHIHPWSLHGPDTEDNLRTLCRSCNCRKGARI